MTKTTITVLVVVTAALIAWDVYLAVNGIAGDTISEVIFLQAQHHPTLPFALGVLCGHWLWGLRVKS